MQSVQLAFLLLLFVAVAVGALYDEVSRDLVALERRIAVDLRNAGRISDNALRRVLYELDLDEARMTAAGIEA